MDETDDTPVVEETTLLTDDTTVDPEENSTTAPAVEESTGEEAHAGEAADGEEEGDQVAPDTYAEFAMPEGVVLDEALLAAATPLFTELGLTQAQAQKLVDFQAEQLQAGSQLQADTFDELMMDWQEQSKADKEFGGDAFEQNLKIAKDAVSKFGTPELKQLLSDHGVGNHPEVIRFMVKVGKLTQEDSPDAQGDPLGAPKDHADLLYGNNS